MSEKPPADLTAAELMTWMENDHSEAVAEAAREARDRGIDVSATETDG